MVEIKIKGKKQTNIHARTVTSHSTIGLNFAPIGKE